MASVASKDPKCKNCGKKKGNHRAKDLACPFGRKDRTGGYSFPFDKPDCPKFKA